MDKSPAPGHTQNPSTGRRVRKIPSTPRPEGTTLPSPRSISLPTLGTSQPPETSAGNLYSRIIEEAMAKFKHDEFEDEETNSLSIGSLSDTAALSDTQATCPTSSSLLGLSTEDESEAEEDKRVLKRSSGLTNRPGREGISRTIEEVASEAIREMHDSERERKGKSVETRKVGEPRQAPPGMVFGKSQENPIREIYDLTETDDEEVTAPDNWRSRMEATVDKLVAANAAQNALLESQREQMTRVVNLVDRMISWMEKGSQSSHQPSPSVSASGQNQPQQTVPDTTPVRVSMKRKPNTTTPDQPTTKDSAIKRVKLELSKELARRSGSQGSQKKN